MREYWSKTKDFFKKKWEHRIVRFLSVGSFNTLFDFVLLNVLFKYAGLPALVANSFSVTIAISISYLLNHRIVFRHPQKYSLQKYARFFLITGLGVLLIQNLIIYAVTKIITLDQGSIVHILWVDVSAKTAELNAAKALAVIVGIAWNFSLYKYLVFRHAKVDPADEIVIV